ncbi:substrate-binding domain-containing protein [Paraburkholderia phosphatilytica]|uniref:substrate-binding domain-containing protein n=1 Tax=Paraburkholderia phosphatilytica TaxID=2282883 RepID=UPI000E4FF0FA|nr:substrate-binding domain-containing protein [Paraburkholderia phosphatilytica]
MEPHRHNAATIRGISSMATRHVLTELTGNFQAQSGQPVAIESVGGVDAARRVSHGEPFDFVALASDAIDKLAAAGHLDASTRVDVARSGVAIAIKAGTPRPDATSENGVRDAVLAARSIGYSTGPSGAHLTRLFERWGIAGTIAPRIVQAQPGVPVATLIARGEVELGFQQLSELVNMPGIDIVGPLPDGIQLLTVFSAALTHTSQHADAARAFLAFLASTDTAAVKLRHGMEPA